MKTILSILVALSVLPFYAFERSQNPRLYDEAKTPRETVYMPQFAQGGSGSGGGSSGDEGGGSSSGSGTTTTTVFKTPDGSTLSYSLTQNEDNSATMVFSDSASGELTMSIPVGANLNSRTYEGGYTETDYMWEKEGFVYTLSFGQSPSGITAVSTMVENLNDNGSYIEYNSDDFQTTTTIYIREASGTSDSYVAGNEGFSDALTTLQSRFN